MIVSINVVLLTNRLNSISRFYLPLANEKRLISLLKYRKQSTLEQKSDSTIESEHLGSEESKGTFETLRNVITHPLTTIQNIISSSTVEEGGPTVEHNISSSNIDENKDKDINTKITESNFKTDQDTITNLSTAINETVESAIPNTIDQISSSEEKKQVLTFKEPESEQNTNAEMQDLVSYQTDETISNINENLLNTIQDISNNIIQSVISNLNQNSVENQQLFSSDNDVVSSNTSEDKSESNQLITNQETNNPHNQTSISDITWTDLVGEKSSSGSRKSSFEEMKQLIEEVIQSSDNLTMEITDEKITITLPGPTQSSPIIEHTTQNTIFSPQTDDILQQSTHESQSDSSLATADINPVSTSHFHEPSPANTEDDSLELIHALQGHSIVLPSASPIQLQSAANQSSFSNSIAEKTDDQLLQAPEKSSSSTTTTSSQITSSDRYVSYAIHEMGDSSQERLPQFPIAADIPFYELNKITTEENKEQQQQQVLPEPFIANNQVVIKDDDLTELDATENLTSFSDDIHLQKNNHEGRKNEDAISTDEDVDDENFNEFEPSDISNLYRIMDEITQQNNDLSDKYDQTYQRYDISNSSSFSTKPQSDDVYIIPGYPGLWKPSADDDDSNHSGFADDEDEKNQSATTVKTKTIVRTTNPAKLQSILQQQQNLTNQDNPIRPDTVDIFNRPLHEFSFDISESDSFKTCASTINSSSTSKQQKQTDLYQIPIEEQEEHQLSPEERIILIRERERGVSLPVTMKIDYDDMALRLSTSTPTDVPLYSSTQAHSPLISGEPTQKTTSSSRSSTPSLSSNESDHQQQQKLPSSSWLNTVNTITTTIEGPDGPLESRTTIHKSAKGPISIAECEPQGKYIVIENTSRSKNIALAGWTLHQENDNGDILTFTFPNNYLLRSNQSLKVLSKSNETERRNSDLIASLLSTWHTGSNVVTKLINAEGKDRSSLTKKTVFS
ncbi:unnamed protein product [Adineta steineri]|uniref:LTD domain-containing protein n=2 Tax=Adineta steineri TaxID=433720 RepID=A0A814X7P2_9BILA|nr:unnamed protein product [Adineta steineri]